MAKEIEPNRFKHQNRGQANRIMLATWQLRIESAGNLENFLKIWAPQIISQVQPVIQAKQQRATCPVAEIIGEISLPVLKAL